MERAAISIYPTTKITMEAIKRMNNFAKQAAVKPVRVENRPSGCTYVVFTNRENVEWLFRLKS